MLKHLIHNAKIWRTGLQNRVNEQQFYNWMIFDAETGKIDSCGTSNNLPQEAVHETIDLGGRWVFPGFHDAHIHLYWHGAFLTKHTNLKIPNSINELQQRLKVMLNDPYNAPEKGNQWFTAIGYESEPLGRDPTSKDFDEIEHVRPVLVYHTSIHVAVVNSMALKLSGIDENTMIEGGEVVLYPPGHHLAGKPTGLLKEKAIDIVTDMISRSKNHIKKSILSAIEDCIELGITSVHCLDKGVWKEFVELANEEKLKIQCFFAVFYDDFDGENKPDKCGESHGAMLKCSCVKIFVDGALGCGTAYLSLPYIKKNQNEEDNYGVPIYSQEELIKMVKEVDDLGYQLEIHVIGDKAAEFAVTALEENSITADKRPILVHCQVLNESLIKRMAKLGVIASIQPQGVPSDASWIHEKLPVELQKCMYPWGTLIKNGVTCAGSSDSPCYYPDSLVGIYDAIFQPDCVKGKRSSQLNDTEDQRLSQLNDTEGQRSSNLNFTECQKLLQSGEKVEVQRSSQNEQQNTDGQRLLNQEVKVKMSLQPDECVTFSQAVDMYTSEAARTDFSEDTIGHLEPGYFANFIVLDVPVVNGNIADISLHPEMLRKTKVQQTWARGVRLY